MQFGLLNVRGSIEARNDSILTLDTITNSIEILTVAKMPKDDLSIDASCEDERATCQWFTSREWKVVSGGLLKDKEILQRVAEETGISPRLIASVVVPEQLRFFTANREVFKRYFEPLKILGSLSKFSLGVSGIKQDTAEKIEAYAKDPNSAFYPGSSYAALIQYEDSANKDEQLFKRLTDEKDHYFSYLYTAIFIQEILSQWERAGYDISTHPEIVSTIFNIGFSSSKPNATPQVGGTRITVGGIDYTFGELSGLFYQSDQLLEIRP